jgi:branched-subunit amino acid aminotransferase/4-amino-4-deoxychorismate lyase
METIGDIILNGRAVPPDRAVISVLDLGFQRGFGCFEALRAYGGKPFRMPAHLDRLSKSAAALRLPPPDRAMLEAAVQDRAAAGGDCIVRVFVSGGTDMSELGTDASTVVLAEPLPPAKASIRIQPRPAPWHSDGAGWELTWAKTLSYGPNLAASLEAQRNGFDDALLVGRSGFVLEGPTFSIGWVRNGMIETPCMQLGILASITRTAAFDAAGRLGIDVIEGEYDLAHVLGADEVFVLSTVKEVLPVVAVGSTPFRPGPITRRLAGEFAALVAEELEDV